MVPRQPAAIEKRCERCGRCIPKRRMAVLADACLCVGCQEKVEQDPHAFDPEEEASREETQAIEVQGDRLTAGKWSAKLMEVAEVDAELRAMMRAGRWTEARGLVQSQSVEVQAALVTVDENPEEVLSLTAMNAAGKPAYTPAVVNRLPTETLATLIKPERSKYLRYNPEVVRAMSAQTFSRAVRETLDPVDYQPLRTKIVWDWMKALASMRDPIKAAELLQEMDLGVIEDAVMDRTEGMGLEKTLVAGDFILVSRLEGLSEGVTGGPPGRFIDDPEIAGVLNGLHEAAPDLISLVMLQVARRLG